MRKLVLENELVPVYGTDTGEKVVYGTDLYECLGSKQEYSNWVKNRLKECDSIENEDFATNLSKSTGGRPKTEYIIKLDTAKEMAMLERNEKGKQVRRYFIQIEKKYKKNQKDMTTSEKIHLLAQGNVELEQKIDGVRQELEDFKKTLPLLPADADQINADVNKRVVCALGGKESNAYHNNSLRGKVFSDIWHELKRQFGVTRYKDIRREQFADAIAVVDDYELPMALQEQIKNCNAQMNFKEAM
nr:MAG TPA: hypothetical protein [Caudoviricetes sp.]